MARAGHASPADVFGFGSHHSARAGAVSATVDDFAAGFYNPAGLAFGTRKRLTFGLVGAVSNLRANGERMPTSEPLGLVIGATSPAPLGGKLKNRIHVGIALYALPRVMVRIQSRLPEQPFFPYYENRAQRLIVLPTLAVRVVDRVSVGIAVNFLGTLAGSVQAKDGATRSLEARVDEAVAPVAKLNAGVRWRARDDLDLALVYRQRFEVPFVTVANTEVAGQPINLDVRASAQFTPNTIVAGVAWRPAPAELTFDIAWANWSEYPGPYVKVTSQLPLLDPFSGELPDVPYTDTITLRAGAELPVEQWRLRGGYAFETSPFPDDQPGVTNLLDGHKHTVAAGAGIVFERVRVDFHAQAQLVQPRKLTKRLMATDEDGGSFDGLRDLDPDEPGIQISNPGYPNIKSKGQMFSGGITVEIAF